MGDIESPNTYHPMAYISEKKSRIEISTTDLDSACKKGTFLKNFQTDGPITQWDLEKIRKKIFKISIFALVSIPPIYTVLAVNLKKFLMFHL